MPQGESKKIFKSYFKIFPWSFIDKTKVGFDMGGGSGRWAQFMAKKVKKLILVEPSKAIIIAKEKLKTFKNVEFLQQDIKHCSIIKNSMDFGYCLGVLHHCSNPKKSLKKCCGLLKRNAPFLIYFYYSFDNKSKNFKKIWFFSNFIRKKISRLPNWLKPFFTELIAIFVYWPLARISLILKPLLNNKVSLPLEYYADKSLYTMRTDARDRFGTITEKRLSKEKLFQLMKESGFSNIKISPEPPFYCAVGFKK